MCIDISHYAGDLVYHIYSTMVSLRVLHIMELIGRTFLVMMPKQLLMFERAYELRFQEKFSEFPDRKKIAGMLEGKGEKSLLG